MTVCTYDNPATMARECWQDGRLVCKYDAALLLRKLRLSETQPVPPEHFFFGANIGDWKAGQLVGDASAMPNVGGEARLAAHQPSHTTTATPQGVASTDQLGV